MGMLANKEDNSCCGVGNGPLIIDGVPPQPNGDVPGNVPVVQPEGELGSGQSAGIRGGLIVARVSCCDEVLRCSEGNSIFCSA